MKKWFLLVALTLVFSFHSCKKDEIENETAKMKLIEKLDKFDVPAVMKNSSNFNAESVVGYVNNIKGVADYFKYFEIPDGATNTNYKSTVSEVVYSWTDDNGTTIWETYSEVGTRYVWKIEIDTGSGRHKYVESQEEKDGSYGILKIYDNTGSSYVSSYDWIFDASDNIILSYRDIAETFKYEIGMNLDFSGYAKWYSGGKLYYYYTWKSDGSGSHTTYKTDGSVSLSESWLVSDL